MIKTTNKPFLIASALLLSRSALIINKTITNTANPKNIKCSSEYGTTRSVVLAKKFSMIITPLLYYTQSEKDIYFENQNLTNNSYNSNKINGILEVIIHEEEYTC
jgi:hypothetical protein